jgi:hypothetical protein
MPEFFSAGSMSLFLPFFFVAVWLHKPWTILLGSLDHCDLKQSCWIVPLSQVSYPPKYSATSAFNHSN